MELLEILFSNGIVTVLFLYLLFAGLSRLFRRGGGETRPQPQSPPPQAQPRQGKQRKKKSPVIQAKEKERLIPESEGATPTVRTESDAPMPAPMLAAAKKKTVKPHPLIADLNQESLKQAIIMKEILDGPRFRRGGNRRGPLGR